MVDMISKSWFTARTMSKPITKTFAMQALDIRTDEAFGEWFRDQPTKQAVGKWGKDEPLPDARQWELRARRPDLFGHASAEEAA